MSEPHAGRFKFPSLYPMKSSSLLLLGLGLGLLSLRRASAGAKDGTLNVYWIDSEGGGSTLIVTPNDESVLIDAGNPGGRATPRALSPPPRPRV